VQVEEWSGRRAEKREGEKRDIRATVEPGIQVLIQRWKGRE
jgi:hypothetical protein